MCMYALYDNVPCASLQASSGNSLYIYIYKTIRGKTFEQTDYYITFRIDAYVLHLAYTTAQRDRSYRNGAVTENVHSVESSLPLDSNPRKLLLCSS